MAKFPQRFDATRVDPSSPFAPIPAGEYVVVISDSKWVATKKGDGRFLELALTVASEGPYRGRRLWDRLNLENPNAQAVEIAQKVLASICRAVAVPKPSDSSELHFRPLVARVVVTEGPNGSRNEVRGYRPAPSISKELE